MATQKEITLAVIEAFERLDRAKKDEELIKWSIERDELYDFGFEEIVVGFDKNGNGITTDEFVGTTPDTRMENNKKRSQHRVYTGEKAAERGDSRKSSKTLYWVLGVVGLLLIAVWNTFGTVDPCEMLTQEYQQLTEQVNRTPSEIRYLVSRKSKTECVISLAKFLSI